MAAALDALARAHGCLGIGALAAQCNLGERQFRRHCLEAAGLPPKHLARVFRLLRVLSERRRGAATWTTLAANGGYSDQAHFVHDFAGLVGCSPSAYAQRRGDVRFLQVKGEGAPL